jgi:hypothetical protein
MKPSVLDDPVITGVAQRVHKTSAQVALAWAIQRGTAFLTTSTKPRRIQESFDLSTLPEDAMREIRDLITTNVRFNSVVETGVPGFIPRPSELNLPARSEISSHDRQRQRHKDSLASVLLPLAQSGQDGAWL